MTGSMLYTKRYPLYDIISTKDYVRIYKLFMQNKANLSQNKPNSNPILHPKAEEQKSDTKLRKVFDVQFAILKDIVSEQQ